MFGLLDLRKVCLFVVLAITALLALTPRSEASVIVRTRSFFGAFGFASPFVPTVAVSAFPVAVASAPVFASSAVAFDPCVAQASLAFASAPVFAAAPVFTTPVFATPIFSSQLFVRQRVFVPRRAVVIRSRTVIRRR